MWPSPTSSFWAPTWASKKGWRGRSIAPVLRERLSEGGGSGRVSVLINHCPPLSKSPVPLSYSSQLPLRPILWNWQKPFTSSPPGRSCLPGGRGHGPVPPDIQARALWASPLGPQDLPLVLPAWPLRMQATFCHLPDLSRAWVPLGGCPWS